MPNTFGSRLKHAWNAFLNRDPPRVYGGGYSYRPDRPRLNRTTDRTILTAIYARMAQDATAITINHVRLDENDRFDAVLDSGLNSCLNLSANKDQTGRALRYDIYLSLLDEGVIVIVPVDIDEDQVTGETEIRSMRVGKVKEWYPDDVRVELYNDRTGQKEEVILPKEQVAIVENPFYSVMNEPNSTVQRLISKLRIMDAVDEQAGSGKLDLIIQLPYTVKSPARKEQAQERRKTLEEQLAGSRYGIGYIDATEHITQLNRSLENNLLKSIEYLTNMAYSQLGLTPEIMNGTADDTVMTNYENRVIEPLVAAVVDELKAQKPLVQAYVMDEIFDKMIGGEAAVGVYYSGDAITMIDDNPDLAWVFPEEGTVLSVDSMAIPATSEHEEAAEMFINFMCEPDVGKANIEYIGYTTPMHCVWEILDEDLKYSEIAYPSEDIAAKEEVFTALSDEVNSELDVKWSEMKSYDEGGSGYLFLMLLAAMLALACFNIWRKVRRKTRNMY